jgi:hypothetical protein
MAVNEAHYLTPRPSSQGTYVLSYLTLELTCTTQETGTQSAGPVRLLIFCSISNFFLASLVILVHVGRRSQYTAGAEWQGMYSIIPSTGISNLFQPTQAEVVSGQLSTYLALVFNHLKLRDYIVLRRTTIQS